MSKPVLYTFGGSVWAAAAELATYELYPEGEIEFKTLNLMKGENFKPSFVKINSNATLPTLLTPDEGTKCTTKDTIAYLVAHAPKKVKAGTDPVIETIHEEKYDPNFSLLLARNDDECKAKAASIPGLFIQGRQDLLDSVIATSEAAEFKSFYEAKTTANSGLLAIYKGTAPAEVKQGFYAKSKAHVANVASCVYDLLPGILPASSFIGGAEPGEDDFHVGAWLTRIAATCGAVDTTGGDGIKALEGFLGDGKVLPAEVSAYWNSWISRDTWKKVYAGGLH